jgi:hypothetical protein
VRVRAMTSKHRAEACRLCSHEQFVTIGLGRGAEVVVSALSREP